MAHQFFFNPYILDNLPAPASGFDVVQDISEPRLRMYITSRGIKTFFVRKRVGGRDKRIRIGNYPEIDIDHARDAVATILTTVAKKPCRRRRPMTFREMFDMYVEQRLRRGEDSRTKLIRSVNRHLGALDSMRVRDITAADVSAVIEKIPGRAIAARMQDVVQSVLNFAIEQGYLDTNPAQGLPKIAQNRRVRPLNRGGLMRLVAEIEKMDDIVMRGAFLMLIYGFAPKSKVFGMSWEDLDFNQYTWRDVPLSDRAVVVLQDLPQDGIWVFPGRGGSHLADPRFAWNRVAAAADIPDLTMDDVHKFIMRKLTWASDREDHRNNMNNLLDELLSRDEW